MDTLKKFVSIKKPSEDQASDQEIQEMFQEPVPMGGEMGASDEMPLSFQLEKDESALDKPKKDPKALIGAKPKPMFYKQTDSVNMDVKGDLKDLENTMREFGETQLPISSGVRSEESVLNILKDRMKRDQLDQYQEAEEVIRKAILRGDSPDNIIYPSGNWRPQVEEQLNSIYPGEPDKINAILNNIGKSRKDFAGYASPHISGMKVDIPRGHFLSKYGEEKGAERYKRLLEFLKSKGYNFLDEPKAGQRGVLDINLKPINLKPMD